MPFRAPVKPRTAVDIYFLIRQPLDPTGETKRAIDTCQRTQTIAHERPFAATLGQSIVVMCLAVMRQRPDSLALLDDVIEISGNLLWFELLKQLRIGPLHAPLG